jgi:hypothetical protein
MLFLELMLKLARGEFVAIVSPTEYLTSNSNIYTIQNNKPRQHAAKVSRTASEYSTRIDMKVTNIHNETSFACKRGQISARDQSGVALSRHWQR